MNCRHCKNTIKHGFLDLGFAPPSNEYLNEKDLFRVERYFPLRLSVCEKCWLVQTEDYAKADELFDADYAYFSSTSRSWLAHAKQYSEDITNKLNLSGDSFVIEIASNDGYLLKNFVEAGVPCLGIEPTSSTAVAAEKIGIPVLQEFFGERLGARLAQEGRQADLICGNNVYAHVPDINDFTLGLKRALKPDGTITLEFPHLMQMIAQAQFDTAYHEHFSYLSLSTVESIFNTAGLSIWDVEELQTHGGSLRVYGQHIDGGREQTAAVSELLHEEDRFGLRKIETYADFQARADTIKDDLILFLIEQKRTGKKVAGYGAAAKGNTILNYAGIKTDLLPFICDAAASKQGKFMPGSHIPIYPPSALEEYEPDYVLVLPWNIAAEVKEQNKHLSKFNTKFVTAVPKLEIK